MALNLKTDPESLVLRQLRGIRQEIAAVLANQARDRELITRMFSKMEQGFSETRRDIAEIRSDLTLLENNLLTRHNEILDLARRVDDPEGAGA